MGQQSEYLKNRLTVLEQEKKVSIDMSKKEYLKEHFLLGCGEDRDRRLHSQLMLETLCTENCEIIDWVWKQIQGLTGSESQEDYMYISVLKSDYNVYNINNYIKEAANWDKVEW